MPNGGHPLHEIDQLHEEIRELRGKVQILIDLPGVAPEGHFTFPDGDTWHPRAAPAAEPGAAAPAPTEQTRAIVRGMFRNAETGTETPEEHIANAEKFGYPPDQWAVEIVRLRAGAPGRAAPEPDDEAIAREMFNRPDNPLRSDFWRPFDETAPMLQKQACELVRQVKAAERRLRAGDAPPTEGKP